MATQRLEAIFHTTLTPATADLISRYAEVDESGFITKYQIINEEVITALKKAAVTLSDELLYGEQLSEHWERKSPCEGCESAPECTMTCRRKHSFDKEVYGGLLCGSLPCSYLAYEDENGEKNKVCFKVRFRAEEGLTFYRPVEESPEGVKFVGSKVVVINGRGVSLRPWSMALYRFFVRHPEGVPLVTLYTDHRKEFAKIYESVVRSDTKSARLKALLKNANGIQRTLNNKLSELNVELRAQGVAPDFMVTSEGPRTYHQIYCIEHLRGAQSEK
ncbi:MAG: hypothetical protein IJD12_05395 [Tidjanibacter sp.]|nr:hypothetical protein [Tidjanibacter sp.]MBQ3071103.1 hypothetical protein [Tidjanibacter sp.]